MNNFVIDASVSVKCFFWEEGSEQCLDLLNYVKSFFAPEFFLVETDAAITKKVRRREITFEEAAVKRRQLRKLPCDLIPYDIIEDLAFELSSTYFISHYDACYLTTAIDQNAKLYTADKRFFNGVSATPFSNHIEKIDY